jgi:hypothetical protein
MAKGFLLQTIQTGKFVWRLGLKSIDLPLAVDLSESMISLNDYRISSMEQTLIRLPIVENYLKRCEGKIIVILNDLLRKNLLLMSNS